MAVYWNDFDQRNWIAYPATPAEYPHLFVTLTVPEASRAYFISVTTVRKACQTGLLRARFIGGFYLICALSMHEQYGSSAHARPMCAANLDRVTTPAQIRDDYGVSQTTVSVAVKHGRLPYRRVGQVLLIDARAADMRWGA